MSKPDDFVVLTPKSEVVYVTADIGTGLDGVAISSARHSITIDGRLRGKKKLDTFIHESLHIVFPEKPEREILEGASFVAEILWKAGYRRMSERNK